MKLASDGQKRSMSVTSQQSVRQCQSARGFTLTELTIVMVLVAILSGLAMTSMSGLTASRQNVAAVRVRTALAFAQEWAMGSSNNTWVAFNTASDLVSVFVEDPTNPGIAGRLAMTDPLTRSAMSIQLGVDGAGIESAVFGATAEVKFDSKGSPSDANGSALVADGTVGMTGGATIRVTRNTGLVTVD